MDQGRLVVAEPRRHVPRQTEVWVLVDRAWNQAHEIAPATQRHRERDRERRGRLHGRERELPNVV